ncbi:MAG: hypothetical protein AzoDbin1_00984 [Azoarcus sp.]|uniref:Uncharacterized protein n=1 Tax=Aromatoleum tolulyticum TaxID=34027 RepID=A0A1N6WRM5_9RHOO|nr:hypothetical protein [Aromatoleum tolulyticum]MCK9984512.1 hypothetical protein [Azoarcus sp.]SIQ92697.1 hypothetical protein SAMN05421829_10846 [Aromatoleum tolulyticum]
MDRGWIQFLLVAVPVVSLIGSWLALRAIAERYDRKPGTPKTRAQAGRGTKDRAGNKAENE